MHTLRGTVLRTSSSITTNYADSNGETGTRGNFRLSTAVPRHILYGARYNRATETTFTISGARNSCNVTSGRFIVQLR